MSIKPLSQRQLEIMQILWNSRKPMTASEILAQDDNLNINTVRVSLRSLEKKGYIKVGDIVHSGTVLARSYVPVVPIEKYVQEACNDLNGVLGSREVLASLIEKIDDISELEELEKMIAQWKEYLDK